MAKLQLVEVKFLNTLLYNRNIYEVSTKGGHNINIFKNLQIYSSLTLHVLGHYNITERQNERNNNKNRKLKRPKNWNPNKKRSLRTRHKITNL